MNLLRLFVVSVVVLASTLAVAGADFQTALFNMATPMPQQAKIKITTNLRQQRGVVKVDVSLDDNTVEVVYNPEKTDARQLAEALEKMGYEPCVPHADESVKKTGSDPAE